MKCYLFLYFLLIKFFNYRNLFHIYVYVQNIKDVIISYFEMALLTFKATNVSDYYMPIICLILYKLCRYVQKIYYY